MPARTHHRLLIPLAALLVCLPLLISGPSCGHDFDFHLLSWLEAATQITHGGFPHWAFTPAWNAGEPRFLFYPPLSWLLGAALGVVLPWPLVPAAFTFLSLTLAGFTMHHLARKHLDGPRATCAAILYVSNPYMLFTAYERTAYGELLAAAFIPLLFAAILTARVRLLSVALPVALIWLANAPAGVMSCYALALLTLTRFVRPGRSIDDSLAIMNGTPSRPRRKLAFSVLTGTALGLSLTAAYLVPAIVEQPLISPQLAVVEGMRIRDNFPFHPMAATVNTSAADAALHNAVLAQASSIGVALFLIIAVSMLCSVHLRAAAATSEVVLPLLVLTAGILLLLTPFTLPIWNHLPELRFLQFPWRLLALVAPVAALFAARALPPLRSAAILLAGVLILSAWHLFHQPCDVEDNVGARVARFHSTQGTDPTDEYTPADADGDALKPGDPPFWLAPSAEAAPPANAAPGQSPTDLSLTLTSPADLILNRRAYPTWLILVNGREALIVARTDGLIALALPAGHDHVLIRERRTVDENAGLGISLASGLLAIILWRKQRQSAKIAK